MKHFVFLFLYIFYTVHLFAQNNSFRPGELWPDNNGVHINAHGGGFLFSNGLYYWFGEHKLQGTKGNTAQLGVHCYSSKDLYNWKDEGIALKVSDNQKSDIAKGCILERPKVVYNVTTKKYIMWFHLELLGKGYSAARCGVAVSNNITGPYVFLKSYRPNAGHVPYINKIYAASPNCNGNDNSRDRFFCRDFSEGQMSRDMTIFIDDNNKAYHVYSSEENYTLQLAELTTDYTAHTGKYIRIYIGHQTEAPTLFKYHGKYFMIGSGCTGWEPNAARWFVADSIWGEWKYMGNPCHGSGADKTFGGQSTFVLPVNGHQDDFIFVADKWNSKNPIDGRYFFLPIRFDKEDSPIIEWLSEWNLSRLN